ncbi:MAG: hypothetical protein JWM76_1072 [Pseudonocardiales bacterium]|nr:hypothetical protein [Pseudonocardiales bacterium]
MTLYGLNPTDRELDAGLNERDCWALLRSQSIGRLAVYANEQLDIFPVNFVVDHATIVFRTSRGTKLSALTVSDTVAFEADGVDVIDGSAWSVVIKGPAAPIIKPQELLDTVHLSLAPMESHPKPMFIRVQATEISGRRFKIASATIWQSPLAERPHAPNE